MIRSLILKKHLRSMLESGQFTPTQKADIETILHSTRGMKELKFQLERVANKEKKLVGKVGDGKILEWLIAHSDEIMAFIRMIVGLFA